MTVKRWKFKLGDLDQFAVDDVLGRVDFEAVPPDQQNSYELDPAPYEELIRHCAHGQELHQLRGVYLPVGNWINAHSHPLWQVCIYMPMESSASLVLHEPPYSYPTDRGFCYGIEPGRRHSVTKNIDEFPRVTLAMLFLP